MERDQFLSEIEERTGLDSRERADEAAEAVLRTLGERITGDEADDLAAQLPGGVDEYVAADPGERFDFGEFTDRVAERTDFDDDEPEVTQAVASVVVDALGRGELRDVVSQFPEDEGYGELLARADENAS